MTKDLNTLLTALYVLIDDYVVLPRTGRGHRPDLTDSELVCLAVAQVMLGYHNERRWVRHVHATPELLGMFPDMLTQSGCHKRLKQRNRCCARRFSRWLRVVRPGSMICG